MVPSICTCGIARFGSSTRTGAVLRERRVRDERASGWSAVFAGHGPMRILLETGTESEWVAQALESGGPRGDRRRPEFRADVWRGPAQGEDGSPRRGGVGRGESPRLVSRDASRVGARSGRCGRCCGPPAAGADAQRDDCADARAAAASGLSAAAGGSAERARRLARAGAAAGAGRDGGAAGADGRRR